MPSMMCFDKGYFYNNGSILTNEFVSGGSLLVRFIKGVVLVVTTFASLFQFSNLLGNVELLIYIIRH